MNANSSRALDSPLQALRELIEHINRELSSPEQPDPSKLFELGVQTHIFERKDYGSLVLFGERGDQYFDCLLALQKVANAKIERISFSAVESATQLAILKALDIAKKQPTVEFSEKLQSALTELRNTLSEQPISWSVHREVAGLDPVGLPRLVGNTEFYVMDQDRVSSFDGRIAAIVDRMRDIKTDKETAKKNLSTQLFQGLLGKTCAHVRVSATDSNAANALALKQLRQTIDVINFFIGILGLSNAQVYLPWEANPHIARSFTLADNGEHSNWGNFWQGPWVPLSFSLIQGKRAEGIGFSRASTILGKSNPNSIEDRLLSAMQWAGRASIVERKEEAFLLFTVALESLLLDIQEKQQLRYRFAVGGAHLLGSGLESKREMSTALKKLYDLRSAIVHSGSTDISDSDRDTVRYFARRAIYRILATKPFLDMSTEDELDKWFEDQVLGPEIETGPKG